jgi:hypothetical protein
MDKTIKRRLCVVAAVLVTTACGRAPSVDIAGSFFPVWMICLTTAVVLSFCVRYLLVRCRIESEVGPVALFYPSLVVLLAGLMWLIFFR